MNNDVEAIRDELARHLVEALMHLRTEACDADGTVRDADVIERLSAVAYLFDEVHGRILALAEAEQRRGVRGVGGRATGAVRFERATDIAGARAPRAEGMSGLAICTAHVRRSPP